MENTIKVIGQGEIGIKPDTIQIHFTVLEIDKKYDKALKNADSKISKLKTMLVRLGIRQKNIVTTNFYVDQKFKQVKKENGELSQELCGYEVKYSILVSFPFNTKLLGNVISKVTDNVATPQIKLSFAVKNSEKAMEDATVLAVKNAEKDAKILAQASNLKLGKIKMITFDNTNNNYNQGVMFCARSNSMESFSNMVVNEIKFSKTVEIEWEIL